MALAVSRFTPGLMVKVWPLIFVIAGAAPCSVSEPVLGVPTFKVIAAEFVTVKPAMIGLLSKVIVQAPPPSGKMATSVGTVPGGPAGVQMPGVAQDNPLVSVFNV